MLSILCGCWKAEFNSPGLHSKLFIYWEISPSLEPWRSVNVGPAHFRYLHYLCMCEYGMSSTDPGLVFSIWTKGRWWRFYSIESIEALGHFKYALKQDSGTSALYSPYLAICILPHLSHMYASTSESYLFFHIWAYVCFHIRDICILPRLDECILLHLGHDVLLH